MYEKKNKIALESQVKYCIAAKPNNLLFLQTVCRCYDGDVETVLFFFLFLFFSFFSPPLQKFPTPSESNKEKNLSHRVSLSFFTHICLWRSGFYFFFCIVDMMPVSAADGPNHRCSHSHVLTRLNSILAFNIRTDASTNCPMRDKKKAYMCVYMY